jgi:crossover junction endodeoxyribonuclease RusA
LIESSKAVRPWREAVKWAAVEYMGKAPSGQPLTGPLVVRMTFTLPKPKSAPKTRRTWPDRKPDLSKLIRSTEDALTDAAVWGDDAQVVECTAVKTYPSEWPGALPSPGATIEITLRMG